MKKRFAFVAAVMLSLSMTACAVQTIPSDQADQINVADGLDKYMGKSKRAEDVGNAKSILAALKVAYMDGAIPAYGAVTVTASGLVASDETILKAIEENGGDSLLSVTSQSEEFSVYIIGYDTKDDNASFYAEPESLAEEIIH